VPPSIFVPFTQFHCAFGRAFFQVGFQVGHLSGPECDLGMAELKLEPAHGGFVCSCDHVINKVEDSVFQRFLRGESVQDEEEELSFLNFG
jgi:hypothetical protein